VKPKILIVEDDPVSHSVLKDTVRQIGYETVHASSGEAAWDQLRADPTLQLACIDWVMPGMDGLALCAKIKAELKDRYVYSIMITSKSRKEDLIQGLEAGADEFLSKPIHPGEMLSRLRAGERVLNYEKRLLEEMHRADTLLSNVLPPEIAARLKQGEQSIADFFPTASILFLDIVGFTDWCLRMEVRAMMEQLSSFFALFDEEIKRYGVEKIKSVGDAYLVAAGLPNPRPDHARCLARLALAIQHRLNRLNEHRLHPWAVRMGIASGPVIAGVIGQNRFIYDVWGATVNNACRLEHAAPQNQILLSEATHQLLAGAFECQNHGKLVLQGIGEQHTWRLVGPVP
jgi:adenylate cyclase